MKEQTYKICKICGLFKPCYQYRLECCDCFRSKQKQYILTHEPDPEYGREYYRKNRERCLEYSRAYYFRKKAEKVAEFGVKIKRKLTREQKNARARAYYLKNIEKMREKNRFYREKRRAKMTPKEIKQSKNILQIIVETGGKCGDFDCKKCPLNYREVCKPVEIVVEAERLLNEKAIRD